MTSVRARTMVRAGLLIGAAAALVAGALVLAGRQGPAPLSPRAEADRPELLLVTSLPLLFAEQFGIDGAGSPAIRAIERRYQVKPIGITDSASLDGGRLLLMAHPRAQPAEALVELDAWVRAGGRVLLLADPRLEWPSRRPLGDPLRPPPAFADTGLLGHWGLTLYAPDADGPADRRLESRAVATRSPGTLAADGRHCALIARDFAARCAVGTGRAIVVADADFLNAPDGSANHEALLAALARLEQR